VLYLQLGVEVLAGAGMYALAGPALSRYRAAVLDARSGGAVARAVAELEAAGFTLSAMETLKSAPRGVPRDHVRIGLLQRKGLVAMFPRLPTASLGSRSFADWITARAVEAAPLTRWLAKHAG
jgi:uncharacterized protein (DUF2461 family)